MGAVTADQIVVDLIANDGPYIAKMGNARRAVLGFEKDTVRGATAIESNVGRSFRASAASADVLTFAMRRLLPLFGATAVLGYARNLMNTADALKDTSAQLGITTQELQGLGYAARVSGASSERLTQALGFLTDNLGAAQKGEGELAKTMRELGIPLGTTMQVLYDLADAVKNADSAQAKMNITTAAFGRGGRELVSFLDQGAEGMRRQLEQAKAKGQIWDDETLRKLDDAKDSFQTLEARLVNIAAVPTSKLIDQISNFLDRAAAGDWKSTLESLMKLSPGGLLLESFKQNFQTSAWDKAGLPFAGADAQAIMRGGAGARGGLPNKPATREEMLNRLGLPDIPTGQLLEGLANNAIAAARGNQGPQALTAGELDHYKVTLDDILKAAPEVGETWTRVFSDMEIAGAGAFQTLEDALVEFTRTGKLNVADLASFMLAEFARVAIRQNITGPLSGLFQSAIGSLGLGGGYAGGFASGGTIPIGQWGNVHDGELVRATPSGAQVVPGVPSIGRLGASSAPAAPVRLLVTVEPGREFDVRVARVGGAAGQQALVEYDRRVLPGRVHQIATDPHAR